MLDHTVLFSVHINCSIYSKQMPLQKPEEVEFNPSNLEHIKAYMFFMDNARQPNIRFILEEPFTNIPAMMQAKLLKYFIHHVDKTFIRPTSVG